VKPHSRASRHNIATVNPIRLGHDSLLVMIRTAGTTAAKPTELSSTGRTNAAYLGSCLRVEWSRRTPMTATRTGKVKVTIPANVLVAALRVTTLIIQQGRSRGCYVTGPGLPITQ
jgi:hypothetical protein